MPVYEFWCPSCQKKVSFLLRRISQPFSPVCPSCGSTALSRLVSPFAYHKSLSTIHEESGEPDKPGPDYYGDPRNIGRWAEKRFQEMGMEMPSQLQETIEAARQGEMPQPVKELQPGLTEI
jgi:putative FmdB family regulatory protein